MKGVNLNPSPAATPVTKIPASSASSSIHIRNKCICGHTQCGIISRQALALELNLTSQNTNSDKSFIYHRHGFKRLSINDPMARAKALSNLGVQARRYVDSCDPSTDHRIALHHYHPAVTTQYGFNHTFPNYISIIEANDLDIFKKKEIRKWQTGEVPDDAKGYHICPSFSLQQAEAELATAKIMASIILGPTEQVYDSYKNTLPDNIPDRTKSNMAEQFLLFVTSPSIQSEPQLFPPKIHVINYTNDEEMKDSSVDELPTGMTRKNLVTAEWYQQNPQAAKYLYGFNSWEETLTYVLVFFKDTFVTKEKILESCMMIRNAESNHSVSLQPIEQCLLTKIRFHQGFLQTFFVLTYGRVNSVISDCIQEWAPKWGKIGQLLSILPINERFLIDETPAEYLIEGFDKVAVLVDGKDYMTDVIRQNSAYQRAMFSDKVKHAAFREIAWTSKMGLSIEHTFLFLGRASETKLVKLWGSYWRYCTDPLEPIIEGEDETNDPDDLLENNDENEPDEATLEMENLLEAMDALAYEEQAPLDGTINPPTDIPLEANPLRGCDHEDSDEEEAAHARDLLLPVNATTTKVVHDMDVYMNNRMQAHMSIVDKTLSKRKQKAIMTEASINASNKAILKKGPDESKESMIEQLELHERLHVLYETKELKKNQLSYYLWKMKDYRDAVLPYLKDGTPLPADIQLIKSRLGKIPAGWSILADRGFKDDAYLYPNFNHHLTPHFIQGREQFESAETQTDRIICKLRYTCEVAFSRVTDERALRDVIFFPFFSIVDHMVDWGHANNNLKQPLQKPSDYDVYFYA